MPANLPCMDGLRLTFILPTYLTFLSLFLVRHLYTDKKRKILRKGKNTDKNCNYNFNKHLSLYFLSVFLKLTKIWLKFPKICFFNFLENYPYKKATKNTDKFF